MSTNRRTSSRSRTLKAVVVGVIVVVLIGVLLGSFGASSGSGSSVDRSGQAGCRAFTSAMDQAGQSQQGSATDAEVSAELQGALSELEQSKDVALAQDATMLDATLTANASTTDETHDAESVANQCSADGF